MTPHANALLTYYAHHHSARRLPWRRPGEPLIRVALVEGLLAMTQARTVARWYDQIFDGIDAAGKWLREPALVRRLRVAPLGLPDQKLHAVDAIAKAMIDGVTQWPAALVQYLGLGPYTAGMIALLFGAEAAPVDTNVERVGRRAASDGDPARWIGDLVRAAQRQAHSHTGHPPGYEVVCAVLDVGATRCHPDGVACDRCPLRPFCASRHLLDRQAAFAFSDPVPARVPRWGHLTVRAVNVNMADWTPRDVTIEAGWTEPGGTVTEAIPVERAIATALASLYDRVETGELDIDTSAPGWVARQVVDRLPGGTPWCRVIVAGALGSPTAWRTIYPARRFDTE